MIRLRYAACLICMFAVFGCGKKAEEAAAEKTIEAATGAKVDISEDGKTQTVEMETPDGKSSVATGEKLAIPADYPKDIPVPAGAEVTLAIKQGADHTLGYTISGAIGAVFAQTQKALVAQGWKEDTNMQTPEESMLVVRKEKRLLIVQFKKTEDGKIEVAAGQTTEN